MLICLWKIFGIFLELVLCATAQFLCSDHSLRIYNLTNSKIFFFPDCGLISLCPSKRQNFILVFSYRHHDSKNNVEIKYCLKINPNFGLSYVCFTWLPTDCVFFILWLSHTWLDLLGHLITSFPTSAHCFH